ncbi:MAG TPA: OsmC family protein [Gemmatimonadaceae bacterium]|nr:OsmC family protein [Gemmatimonadaceae bacterium]
MTATSSPPAASPTLRQYDVSAKSTDVFGRVLCATRDHHFIVDGPVQNGCPGEEITPVELFLSAVAACGVELVHVIAREQNAPLERVAVQIHGESDRAKQTRTDVSTLNTVQLDFQLWGVSDAQAAALVEGFKRR